MKSENALKSIAVIAFVGLLFSGYLSYSELFVGKCLLGSCPFVASIPACVYGFFMYLIVLIVSLLGLKSDGKRKK